MLGIKCLKRLIAEIKKAAELDAKRVLTLSKAVEEVVSQWSKLIYLFTRAFVNLKLDFQRFYTTCLNVKIPEMLEF